VKIFLRFLVLTAIILSPVAASASPLSIGTINEWQYFKWDGLGPIDLPDPAGFDVTSADPFTVRITDVATNGDCFNVTFNKLITIPTSLVTYDSTKYQSDYNLAFNDPAYSKGIYYLAPGTYHIDISVTALSPAYLGDDEGAAERSIQGGIQATSNVPIPAAIWLLGSGLLGLLGIRRKLS
jgi:hypothetical protein